ncbi:13035_t:CDS:10 [Ambispora gerdemannii]|uniref:13035_t:CDS:1 n=1 Tax=Ambispora gerdemannii TaxID=144530 RepID=A0A9N8ZXT3_9GLOM|nr:13035_t:CDS:10 [Ambispora gerdemannii]
MSNLLRFFPEQTPFPYVKQTALGQEVGMFGKGKRTGCETFSKEKRTGRKEKGLAAKKKGLAAKEKEHIKERFEMIKERMPKTKLVAYLNENTETLKSLRASWQRPDEKIDSNFVVGEMQFLYKCGVAERRRSPEKSSRSLRSRSRSPGGRRDRALSPRSSERRDPKYDRERKSKADSPSRKEEVTTPSEGSSNNLLGDIDPDENPEQALMALMGMTGFSSTKGKKVTGNETSAVNIKKQRQYRQYMNRRGGFNRPLDRVQ